MRRHVTLLFLHAVLMAQSFHLLLIFKRKTLPKDVIPHGIYVHVHSKGWMDGEGMKLWLEKVWSKHPGGLLKKPSLWVCDLFKAHVTESTKGWPLNWRRITVIPSGLTSQLQPLDISVNKLFKGFMHEEWAKWIEAPTHNVTLAGRVKRPSISNVGEWVKNSWQQVKCETIVKSLRNVALAMH